MWLHSQLLARMVSSINRKVARGYSPRADSCIMWV